MKIVEGYLEEARTGQLVIQQEWPTRREVCGIGLAEGGRKEEKEKERGSEEEGVLEVRGFWFLSFTS